MDGPAKNRVEKDLSIPVFPSNKKPNSLATKYHPSAGCPINKKFPVLVPGIEGLFLKGDANE
jgi:hypothetical protein